MVFEFFDVAFFSNQRTNLDDDDVFRFWSMTLKIETNWRKFIECLPFDDIPHFYGLRILRRRLLLERTNLDDVFQFWLMTLKLETDWRTNYRQQCPTGCGREFAPNIWIFKTNIAKHVCSEDRSDIWWGCCNIVVAVVGGGSEEHNIASTYIDGNISEDINIVHLHPSYDLVVVVVVVVAVSTFYLFRRSFYDESVSLFFSHHHHQDCDEVTHQRAERRSQSLLLLLLLWFEVVWHRASTSLLVSYFSQVLFTAFFEVIKFWCKSKTTTTTSCLRPSLQSSFLSPWFVYFSSFENISTQPRQQRRRRR